MTEAEDWLYGDGFDSTKQQYTKKIEELRALGDPIEQRLHEEQVGIVGIASMREYIEYSGYNEAVKTVIYPYPHTLSSSASHTNTLFHTNKPSNNDCTRNR